MTARTRFIAAAFDHGQVPTIACFNKATAALGVDFGRLIATLQTFVDEYFVPVWGTPARLVKTTTFRKGAWAIAFLDRADVANALGYHDLTPDGLPLSKVFVQSTLAAGQKVSVTACHELAEMLVDPAINLCSTGPNNLMYAYETADAVEEVEFSIGGIPMSDFVYPAWFEGFRKPGSAQFDYSRRVKRPFQILPGGYMSVFKNGRWTQIFGSRAKARRFRLEERRGHRSTYRGKTHRMKPSRPRP
ncbi:MAG TPA: hypothetical protein VEM13_04620 [Gemmatimonadales bacterium]|nr:hypothetical protein [Gemmatimonadales bacterium]